MAEKRKSTAGTPRASTGSAKRQKTTDARSPSTNTPSRAAPTLSDAERTKLIGWLDDRAKSSNMPFPISFAGPVGKGKKGRARPGANKEMLMLDGHEYGTVEYTISNRPKWDALTKYRKCTVGEETLEPGQCIFVKGDETTDPEKSPEDPTLPQWKAQLHEVRAINENHVYLRVTWLYRAAHDLPQGEQDYHGKYELVPSTEMTIIDAMSVNGSIKVRYWDEYKDDEVPAADEYYWRQSCDHVTGTLSSCRQVCICSTAHNPDHPIVQCGHCKQWMHTKCIEAAAVKDVVGEHESMTNGTEEQTAAGAESEGKKSSTPKGKKKSGKARKSSATVNGDDKPAADQPQDVVAEVHLGDAESNDSKAKVIVTDKRGTEPAVEEHAIKCLFAECRKIVDE